MSVDPFLAGATVRVTASIIALANNLSADPGGLVLKISKPDKSLVTLTYLTDVVLVRDSAGHFHADILLDQPGIWHWRWEASDPNSGVAEGQLTVKASQVI